MSQALATRRRSSRRYYAGNAGAGLSVVGGLALLGGGALLWVYRGTLLNAAIRAGGIVGWYPDPSSRAALYAQQIAAAASATGVDPSIIAGLGDRETLWGLLTSPKGSGGTGDFGHGHGLMQIDDRTWASWLASNDWTDPYTNILKGAQIYAAGYQQLQSAGVDPSILAKAAACAYNAPIGNVLGAIQAGNDPDTVTTGPAPGLPGNYGSDVMARAAKYAAGAA